MSKGKSNPLGVSTPQDPKSSTFFYFLLEAWRVGGLLSGRVDTLGLRSCHTVSAPEIERAGVATFVSESIDLIRFPISHAKGVRDDAGPWS